MLYTYSRETYKILIPYPFNKLCNSIIWYVLTCGRHLSCKTTTRTTKQTNKQKTQSPQKKQKNQQQKNKQRNKKKKQNKKKQKIRKIRTKQCNLRQFSQWFRRQVPPNSGAFFSFFFSFFSCLFSGRGNSFHTQWYEKVVVRKAGLPLHTEWTLGLKNIYFF